MDQTFQRSNLFQQPSRVRDRRQAAGAEPADSITNGGNECVRLLQLQVFSEKGKRIDSGFIDGGFFLNKKSLVVLTTRQARATSKNTATMAVLLHDLINRLIGTTRKHPASSSQCMFNAM